MTRFSSLMYYLCRGNLKLLTNNKPIYGYKKSYNQNGANGKLTLETNVGDVDVDY